MTNRRIILLIVILAILAMAASAGHVEAASDQIVYTEVHLTDGLAVAMYCQREADPATLGAYMYIYPWVGQKGQALMLYLAFSEYHGDCTVFTAPWTPQDAPLYHADVEFTMSGNHLLGIQQAATFARVWMPMAFYSGAPESRPEVTK